MFNSTYGAGYRTGLANMPVITTIGDMKVFSQPENPFPHRRFISRFLWELGFYEGHMQSMKGGHYAR